jgi:hypothetical protein
MPDPDLNLICPGAVDLMDPEAADLMGPEATGNSLLVALRATMSEREPQRLAARLPLQLVALDYPCLCG